VGHGERRLLTLAFLFVGVIANSRVSSLHGHYPASQLLQTPPPPSRLSTDFPVSPVIGFPFLHQFLSGTRRVSPVALRILVIVLSL
jgi:hypothetical protein